MPVAHASVLEEQDSRRYIAGTTDKPAAVQALIRIEVEPIAGDRRGLELACALPSCERIGPLHPFRIIGVKTALLQQRA